MWMYILLVLIVTIVTLVFQRKMTKFPPGPIGLPLIGYAPFIDTKRPYKTYYELFKKYGDIVSITVFGQRFILINEYNMLKLTYSRQSCIDRPDLKSVNRLYDIDIKGVLNASGTQWSTRRKFLVKYLKSVMDNRLLEESIQAEVDMLMASWQRVSVSGEPITPSKEIISYVFNVTWRMIFGKRVSAKSRRIEYFVCNEATEQIHQINKLFFHGLLPKWLRDRIPLQVFRILRDTKTHLKEILEDEKIEARARLDEGRPPSYFLDYCLTEMQEPSTPELDDFSDLDIQELVVDLLIAGSETSATTVALSLLYCIKYPEIQETLFQEIRKVTGGEPIKWDDLAEMHYLRSFTTEILRKTIIVPVGLPRTNNEALIIRGYEIPKNSMLFANHYAIHNDPRNWEDFSFNPKRFLNAEGYYESPGQGYLPFSIGKRQCPGSQVAKLEVFMFLASIIQKFKLTAVDASELNPEPNPGVILQPPHYKMNVQMRDTQII